MGCETRSGLLIDYLATVRHYTKSVEDLRSLAGIPTADYAAAFKLCDAARELSQKAQRLLQRHIADHNC